VTTPALDLGLLAGITRMRAIELLRRDGVEVREAVVWPDDLRGAGEAFITSSIRGVVPVSRVDGSPVGDGRPGPVTRRLMERYAEHLAAVAAL
jgi:branched-subunit amino acid aminotransferase/4-amino-4-deoxychorismate lyase